MLSALSGLMTDALQTNTDTEVPLDKKLDDLYALIDGIDTAMLTTRSADGSLVSRAMATQRRTAGADLWFMANWSSQKLDDIAVDPHVNVSYFRDRTREWVSVSGQAIISRDGDLIRGLYKPEWKAWLGDEGGAHDGGPNDPRITLILVTADSVVYSKNDRPMPLQLFSIAKAMMTGKPPKIADLRQVSGDELREGARKAHEQHPLNP
jgi:general stress protein 26